MADVDWARLQAVYEMTDEELERVKASPKLVKVMQAGPRIVRTRMVAEVTASKFCSHGLKPGQRYVISIHGKLLPEKCTAPICAYMVATLILPMRVMHDRVCEGLDPNGLVWDHMKCLDMGLECGGLGEVAMKVWAEEAPPKGS